MTNTTDLSNITDPDFRLLCEQVVEGMERFSVPGVAVGVVVGGEEHAAGFGVTNVENPLPVTTDTLFQIGSTTKTVTGTAAMRLVEEGKLDLDEPVRTYLPELRLLDEAVASRVTLRHVFTHTAGWLGDYFDDEGSGDDALARFVTRMAELPQLTPLGEVWSYNNAGFYLAGRVLEVVAGKPYEAVAKELVLEPLGMATSFFFASEVITYRVAVGHAIPYDEGGPKVEREWALGRAANAVGGIVSTVKDQLRYARFHIGDGKAHDGTRLLSPETVKLMQTPQVPAENGQYFGITWFLQDSDGVRIVRHGGVTNGQISAFMLVPEKQFAITVLTNANRGGSLHRDVTRWAFKRYLGVKIEDPEPVEASEEQLTPYVGRYSSLLSDVELSLEGGGLVLNVTPKGGFPKRDSPPAPTPPPMRVALCGDDRIIILDEPGKSARGEFLRDAEGRIAWLRLGGRVMRAE